jgi:hypothetical protein
VAHDSNPTFLRGWDREHWGLKLAPANSLWDPHLQNNHSKMDWRFSSSGRSSALQAQNHKFKPQSHKIIIIRKKLGLVAHTCNPSYLEDYGLKPDWAKSLWDPQSQPIAGHSGIYLSPQTTWEAEIWRIVVPGQPWQKKFSRPPSQKEKSWVWWHASVIPVRVGHLK